MAVVKNDWIDNTGGTPVTGVDKVAATHLNAHATQTNTNTTAIAALTGVDEYHEYANLAAFPGTGVTDRIYVAVDTGLLYRWTGSVYVQIGGSTLDPDLVALAALTSPATKLTNASTRVFDARDYGVVADGAAHNNVANLLDCFTAAYAAGASEVLLPAGVIYTGDANLGTVTAASGATYTNNGGIPLPINKPLTVTGHGKGVTTLKLSTGFTRGFDFGPYTADGQIYRDVTIRGITFDRNSLSGTNIGPLTTITSNVTIPGDGTPTVLPGLSAATWRNAKWAYTPASNAGTLKSMMIWVGVSGSNVVAMNYYGSSYTLNTGDQIGARLSEHVIVGTSIWGSDGYSGGKSMTIKNILVDSCQVLNATTIAPIYGVNGSDRSFGVGINLQNGGSQASATNVVVRNTDMYGGAYGCQISGAAGTWLDNIWYIDCFHDTMLDPTINYEAANFMVGFNAWVGRAGAIRCWGRRSGDVAWEIDQPWEGYEEDCVWEESWQGSYRTTFQPPARTAAGPVATTLNNGGTLTSGASTCTVTSLPAGVDRSGLARIDSELVWYQASNLAGTTWNIWRGINSSTAASHTTSAAVTFVETHKTRVYCTRMTIKNNAILAATSGIAGRAWSSFTNSNLPLPPLTVRDPNITLLGGDLSQGQLMYQSGWCPEMDFQGIRATQSSIVSTQGSTALGTGFTLVSPGTAALAANSVPAPAQRLIGRNNRLHIHGKAPNTTSGGYAAFRVWDGFWKYDFDLEAEVSLADVPNTNIIYLQNSGSFSGSLVVAPGSRLGVAGRVPTEVGVTAPIGLFVGSTTYVTIQTVLSATLDLSSNFTPTSIDATQVGKVLFSDPVSGDYLPAGFATMPRYGALNDVATVSGRLALQYFTADKTATVSNMRASSWSTAAGATPTLVRFGIYSVDAAGNLALIAATPSDTTLFSGTFQIAAKALSTAVTLTKGNRYAFGLLIVSAAAMPTVLGSYVADSAQSPRVAGVVTGQSDLPSTITAGTVGAAPSYGHYIMGY